MILYPHFDTNAQGHLTIGGVDTLEIAREFGTPAYVLDEQVIRENCRTYLTAARRHFGDDALPLYASKALCFT
ncbi:MAG: diaminopimelate decarboxylase, partial [Clostridia bacterium]|nr:diaminopimelate decarboxylase [Clostridia bacterium]